MNTPNTSAGMTLNLTSHNDLLALDEPWHNRDSPEFGEENVPYVELRSGLNRQRFSDYWNPYRDKHTLDGFLRAIKEMIQFGRLPSAFYTHVRFPKGHVIAIP